MTSSPQLGIVQGTYVSLPFGCEVCDKVGEEEADLPVTCHVCQDAFRYCCQAHFEQQRGKHQRKGAHFQYKEMRRKIAGAQTRSDKEYSGAFLTAFLIARGTRDAMEMALKNEFDRLGWFPYTWKDFALIPPLLLLGDKDVACYSYSEMQLKRCGVHLEQLTAAKANVSGAGIRSSTGFHTVIESILFSSVDTGEVRKRAILYLFPIFLVKLKVLLDVITTRAVIATLKKKLPMEVIDRVLGDLRLRSPISQPRFAHMNEETLVEVGSILSAEVSALGMCMQSHVEDFIPIPRQNIKTICLFDDYDFDTGLHLCRKAWKKLVGWKEIRRQVHARVIRDPLFNHLVNLQEKIGQHHDGKKIRSVLVSLWWAKFKTTMMKYLASPNSSVGSTRANLKRKRTDSDGNE